MASSISTATATTNSTFLRFVENEIETPYLEV